MCTKELQGYFSKDTVEDFLDSRILVAGLFPNNDVCDVNQQKDTSELVHYLNNSLWNVFFRHVKLNTQPL